MHSTIHNFAATCAARNGGQLSITAGAGQDGVEQTGPTLDKLDTGAGPTGNIAQFGSGRLDIDWTVTLAATKTLSLGVKIQDSADGANWNTAVVLKAPTVVSTGVQTATRGVTSYQFDLGRRYRYFRFLITPDLSAADTDTALLAFHVTLGAPSATPLNNTFQNAAGT